MKTTTRSRNVENHCSRLARAAGALVIGALQFSAPAQGTNAPTPDVASATITNTVAASVAPAAKPEESRPAFSPGVQSLLTLADGKVSKDVMLKFIQTTGLVESPNTTELVALKEHGVPDEVVMAMLSRGAEVKTEARNVAANRRVAVPAIVGALSTDGEMDPDSYDFFFYHYTYPRALASSYRTLTPYLPTQTVYPAVGVQTFPYSSGFSAGRRPVASSSVPYGTLPARTAVRR